MNGALRRLSIVAGALVLLTACGQTTSTSTTSAANAKSAADMGGIDALIAAAKKEGKLNIIAVPPDWANYGEIITGFTAKYGIPIDSANPNGSSQDEVNAVKQLAGTTRAPDVLDIGKAVTLREGIDACFIGAGTILSEVMKAAEALTRDGIRAGVESFHTVKPLDEERLAQLFGRYPLVAVVEEHGLLGGLGGSIAEWRARQDGRLARMLSFGAEDSFLHEIGSQDYARRRYGIDAATIASRVRAALRPV